MLFFKLCYELNINYIKFDKLRLGYNSKITVILKVIGLTNYAQIVLNNCYFLIFIDNNLII